jgi:tetratricopeptide (TPR) repeat protein/DNA-binding response OmpR family regulator
MRSPRPGPPDVRPDYFAPANSAEDAVLRRIKGNFRRHMISKSILNEGLASIPELWCAHAISEDFKGTLTSTAGPRARGGEDLPDLAEGEVEIARLTLIDSVHGEVTSLRAKRDLRDHTILLSMVDEYETEFSLSTSKVSVPLTAEEVLAVFQDADPTPISTTCQVQFSSFFYPSLNDIFLKGSKPAPEDSPGAQRTQSSDECASAKSSPEVRTSRIQDSGLALRSTIPDLRSKESKHLRYWGEPLPLIPPDIDYFPGKGDMDAIPWAYRIHRDPTSCDRVDWVVRTEGEKIASEHYIRNWNVRTPQLTKETIDEIYRRKSYTTRRILVVHHEPLIAEVMRAYLEEAMYDTRIECSSAEAIRAVSEFTPDLLIIDPVMPQISGLDAAKEIFGQTRCKVLLASAGASDSGFEEILRDLRGDGCDCAALGLPFEKEELLELVRSRIGPEVVFPNDTGHRARNPEDVHPKSDLPGSMIDSDNMTTVMPDAELAKQKTPLVRLGLNNPANRAARKGRILLINDQVSLLEVMEQMLVANGYEVRSTSSQQDGITLARSFDPHIVMLGVTMPLELGRGLFTASPSWPLLSPKMVLWGEVHEIKDLEQRRDYYDFDLLPTSVNQERLFSAMQAWMAEAWTQRGNPLHARDQWLDALKCHENALAVDPGCCNAWLNKGWCLDALRKWDEAIDSYERAIEINASDWTPWVRKGDLLDRVGRFEEAILCFDSALAISKDLVSAWMGRGLALHHLGHYQEALLCYDKVLEIDHSTWTAYGKAHTYSDAWNSKGASLYRMGRYKESIECYEKAIEIDPDFAFPWYNKGNSFRELNTLDEAIRCYDRAIELEPGHAKSWNNKGICLRKMGRLAEALACHEKAITCIPPEALGWYNKALVEDDLGRIDDAIGSYEKYLTAALPDAAENAKHAEERLQVLRAGATRQGNNDPRSNLAEDPHAIEITVIRPANNPLPEGIEYESLKICRECLELRGVWRPKGATQTPGSKFRLSYYTQECKCEEASSILNESWPGFDFKKAVELCHCCGVQPILTGSKFSPWFCSDCEALVLGLNRKYRRYVIPFGRHSFHGGSSLGGQALKDQAEIAYFAQRASELSDDMNKVQRFAKQILSENLQTLGYGRKDDVELNAYLAALAKKPVSKQSAFVRLCGIFDVEP